MCKRCGCTQCKNHKYLSSSGSCVSSCPTGYSGVGLQADNRVCDDCADVVDGCAQCYTVDGFDVRCSRCNPGLSVYEDYECVPLCSDYGAFFPNATSGACQSCYGIFTSNCYSCSATRCFACDGNKYLAPDNQSCLASCPSGSYGSGSGVRDRECISCSENINHCATCDNSRRACV